jgi:RNA polymerase sigma-70 factor (ECF subfamily)
MEKKTDEALVVEIQEGNILAFETLVGRYQRGLLSFVYRIVWDEKTAEEVVQDAFFSVYRSIGSIDTSKKFSTYMFTLAKNAAISALRKRKPSVKLEEMMWVEDDEPFYEKLLRDDLHESVSAAIQSLPHKYQQVIDLYYFQDLSYEEVSQKLKLPVNTVRTHLKRAKEALKKKL